MHRYRPLMITIALLFAMCLFSACASPLGSANQTQQAPAPNVTPNIDVGVVSVNMTPAMKFISFAEAKGYFKDSEMLSLNQLQKATRILFIRGGNLDGSGNAERWVFGINKGDINELRVYSSSGWTVIPWKNTISAEEINLDKVVSPKDLISQNEDQIPDNFPSNVPVQRDIELKNGTYSISISSGSTSEILVFNATTGAAIE